MRDIGRQQFEDALQVSVTMPENEKKRAGFVSVAQYPRSLEADDNEFGMIVEDGRIKERLFSSS